MPLQQVGLVSTITEVTVAKLMAAVTHSCGERCWTVIKQHLHITRTVPLSSSKVPAALTCLSKLRSSVTVTFDSSKAAKPTGHCLAPQCTVGLGLYGYLGGAEEGVRVVCNEGAGSRWGEVILGEGSTNG